MPDRDDIVRDGRLLGTLDKRGDGNRYYSSLSTRGVIGDIFWMSLRKKSHLDLMER